jgi:hypothetical protein
MCLYSRAPILPIAPGPEQAFRTLFGCCPPPTTVNQTKRTDNRIRGLDAARDEKVEMADRRLSGNYTATVRFDGVLFRKAHLSLPTLADDPERVAYETGSRCFPCPTIAPINQPFVA